MIKKLVKNSFRSIDEGLYDIKNFDYSHHDILDLKKNIISMKNFKKNSIITEIKLSSPSTGNIVDRNQINLVKIASEMVNAGAIGLSVLTQKYLFNGSIDNFVTIRRNTPIPMLMKDIIVSQTQIDAARKIGADYILLIKTVFDNYFAEGDIEKFAEHSHKKGLNVLFEVHRDEEYKDILDFKLGKNDMVGINNRDLGNLKIDLKTTENLLKKYGKGKSFVISESGIDNTEQIKKLRNAGVDAFLIGTSIMEKSKNVLDKVREFVNST